MAYRNPFKPTAGASPPLLVGRDEVLEEFEESIDDGPGAPGRLSLITGPRGVGKTVVLNAVHDIVVAKGWIAMAETATTGMCDRITQAVRRHHEELRQGRSARVRGITLPVVGGGLTFESRADPPADLRESTASLLDELEPNETGLLITVDEVHRKSVGEIRHLATVVQHLVREDRNIALVMAGLPSAVSDVLSDSVLTFMRRASREELSDVSLADVRESLAETITRNGRTITSSALDAATEATGGYPFMVQLVGYHCWRKTTGSAIDDAATSSGIPAARKRLGSTVHAAALADLSAVDRTVLLAIAVDDGPARTADVARRIGESAKYVSIYRQRLIDAAVIQPAGRGFVDFTIPYLREYLREHVASAL